MKIKQQILITAILSATLIFLIRLFETRFLSGQLSTRVYISIIGIVFFGVGIWFGLSFTKNKTIIKIVQQEPEVKVNANELLTAGKQNYLP